MFNDLLEKRVAEATDDYRRSMLILESAIKSSRSVDFVLKLHAESLLEYAKTIPIDETLPPAQLRGLVTRLVRRLDPHVQLIRHGQPRAAERLARDGEPRPADL